MAACCLRKSEKKQGGLTEAINYFTRAVKIEPDNAMHRYNLGRNMLEEGRVDAAIRQLREALRINPDFTDARRALAAAR